MRTVDTIRRFVQNTLGCGCPEEVFRSIDVRRDVRLNSFVVLDSAIIIGNRLLVYVTDVSAEGCIEEHLSLLMEMGKKERDEKGLNRFRLVLMTDVPEEMRLTAGKLYNDLRGTDERVHLHVIGRKSNPFAAATSASAVEPAAEGRQEGPASIRIQ
jgi:hypothetical protein